MIFKKSFSLLLGPPTYMENSGQQRNLIRFYQPPSILEAVKSRGLNRPGNMALIKPDKNTEFFCQNH